MAYRQRMSDLLEQVRNPKQEVQEAGPSDYLKSKMTDTQINNIKKTWAMKTAKDVTPAIKKMIKDLDIPTQLAIKHANINQISKLVEEDHEISMAQGELKAISAKANDLANMLSTKSDDTDELEAWVQSKITKAKDYIADKGFDSDYGARPLKRAIQKYIEDALAEEIVNSKLTEGDTISMDLDDKKNELTIKIKKGEKVKEKKTEAEE